MAKDPAFLLYSKDYYEGTRTMLPEERACYIDLLVYQHQHESIPYLDEVNLKRMLQYCSGIDEATLKATLKAKFKLTDKGWINERMNAVVVDRNQYTSKQSVNGSLGQFFKKSKSILNSKEYNTLKKHLYPLTSEERLSFIEFHTSENKASLEASLQAMLKHIANANANEDGKEKGVQREKQFTPPTLDEVKEYFKKNGYSEEAAKKAYDHYNIANWHDTTGKPVLSWKQKINTVWFKPEYKTTPKQIESTRYSRNPVSV